MSYRRATVRHHLRLRTRIVPNLSTFLALWYAFVGKPVYNHAARRHRFTELWREYLAAFHIRRGAPADKIMGFIRHLRQA